MITNLKHYINKKYSKLKNDCPQAKLNVARIVTCQFKMIRTLKMGLLAF